MLDQFFQCFQWINYFSVYLVLVAYHSGSNGFEYNTFQIITDVMKDSDRFTMFTNTIHNFTIAYEQYIDRFPVG